MLTKFVLHIQDKSYELGPEDLKNWDEVRFCFIRSGYGGVVRSLTSQFEFVNNAYDLILDAFLKERYNAVASVEVQTINDRWIYESQFICDIDFSSITWNDYVVKVNCLDSSLAAMIKAGKSITYEFEMGTEIKQSLPFLFNRIPMIETLAYQVIGESNDNDASMKITAPAHRLTRPYVGITSEEVAVNGKLSAYGDQNGEADSYMIIADEDVSVNVQAGFAFDRINGYKDISVGIYLYKTDTGGQNIKLYALGATWAISQYVGEFTNASELPALGDLAIGSFASVSGIAWVFQPTVVNGQNTVAWVCSELRLEDYVMQMDIRKYTVDLKAGEKLWIGVEMTPWNWEYNGDLWVTILRQEIKISWEGKGDPARIDTIKPKDLCEKVLERICMEKIAVNVDISEYDDRIVNTYLLPAESIRGISGAKIYSSFNDFANWMETVFGYTYFLGPRVKAQFKRTQEYSLEWTISATDHLNHSMCPGGHGRQVVNIKGTPYFAVLGDDYNDDKSLNFYTKWEGSEAYNDPATGKARLDTLFYDEYDKKGCFFDSDYNLNQFEGDVNRGICDTQTVHFAHRSELFQANAGIKQLTNAVNIRISADNGNIYSSVTIGYDKKDYESINGRDEFNFCNTYSTGCTSFEKELTLKSKFRADCYGIEFATQKRGKDTTDSTSDKDVFFVLCMLDGTNLIPDRTANIENTLSQDVFNGAFSPMACVKANEGYIGLQAPAMTLSFTSSMGNSDIVINGQELKGDIEISNPFATNLILEFYHGDVDYRVNPGDIIEVSSHGIIYRGFLKEADYKVTREESIKYKLIIKEIIKDEGW